MKDFRAIYVSSRESVHVARRALLEFARGYGLCGQALEDFETAVGEALANAAEHGFVQGGHFRVNARFDNATVMVEITDDGPGFSGWNDPAFVRPKSDAPRGFGLIIMRTLMDRVEFGEGGTCIRLIRHFDAASFERRAQEA